ncbi:hypothetical protein C8A01DRAFT_41404 [Parachaetomium inaequale]|uniref:Uncharacterized protein n=1 Tax=Parachaetomium inaequale TaxID=2588326 RepID=A0AAN6SLX1_9PEZI|nr:hypothetical protein C8A01DRAFT_41404 [Parachaetomium inaequale]
MQFPAHLLALILAATAAVPSLGQTDTPQPPCAGVPNNFWLCISDCLYKICPGDDACYKACDADCKEKFVPDCEPGIN